jgi:hypothetical protein
MSAINLDVDAGVGAFASINAQQGYRPVPIAKYAVQLMSASAAGKAAPAPPEIEDPTKVKNAADYVGLYSSNTGNSIEITGDGALFATVEGQRIALQHSSGDSFIAADPLLAHYAFAFGRAKNETAKEKDKEKDKGNEKPGPVVELMHGTDWYTNAKYTGPKTFTTPPEYAALIGTYLGAGAFEGSMVKIVILKGELWAGGQFPLERIGEYEFRPTEDAPNPERVEFLFIVNGKARLLKFTGADFFRFETE